MIGSCQGTSTRSSPPPLQLIRSWRPWCCRAAPTCRASATPANSIFGNTGNNLIDGGAGADVMEGGAGNDTYFVDNAGDAVIENAGQGNDTVFASVNYGLTANVETLVLQGSADLQGFGNGRRNIDLRQYRQQPYRRRRRRRRHGRRRRQRHLLRRQRRRRRGRECRRGQRRGVRLAQLRAGGECGDAGAAGQRRPAGLRQRQANSIFGNTGNNLHRRRRPAPTP